MNILIIGGSNIDFYVKSHQPIIQYDSNPGSVEISHGGVARNICENLARLGIKSDFITPLSHDSFGLAIKDKLTNLGVQVHPIDIEKMPMYVALLDESNDMFTGISAMEALDALDGVLLSQYQSLIEQANMIIIDTNLNHAYLDFIFKYASNIPIYVDAISTIKGKKLIPYLDKINTLKVNRYEAKALSDLDSDNLDLIADRLIALGIRELIITLGEEGVLYKTLDKMIRKTASSIDIINATGAGDAYFAGFIAGRVLKKNELMFAQACAEITLESYESVSKKLSVEEIERRLKEKNDE